MVKLLFLIASHKNPQQVSRLIRILKTGSSQSQILIHHDCSASYLNPGDFNDMHGIHILKNHIAVEWGDFTIIEAVLHCFKYLMDLSIEFDWLIFLSGQDYPIRPLNQLEQFLESTEYDGFMRYGEAKDVTLWGENEGENRYFYCYYKLPHFPYYYKLPSTLKNLLSIWRKSINKVQTLIRIKPFPLGLKTRLGVKRISTPFTPNFKCYRGSTWFKLSRRCVHYIYKFILENPDILRYYGRTFAPDESLFHTTILNNDDLKISNNNLHYISWNTSTSAHPDILVSKDFDRIISSKQFFARKFDMEADSQILNMLDEYIQNNN